MCKINIHKRCRNNVANNCGTNTKDMAQILQEMGISGEKLRPKTKKVNSVTAYINRFKYKKNVLNIENLSHLQLVRPYKFSSIIFVIVQALDPINESSLLLSLDHVILAF